MSQQKNPSEKLPLVQHLIELRRSLLRSVIAIAIFFLMLFPFADEIYNFIAAPIVQAIPGSNLIAIGVISPFLTPLKMSLDISHLYCNALPALSALDVCGASTLSS